MTAPSAAPAWATAHIGRDEVVLWWARPSLVGLMPILTSMAAAVAYLFFSLRAGLDTPSVVTGSAAAVLAGFGIITEAGRKFVRLRYTSFVITDAHIYAITTFLSTNVRAVPLAKATRVALRQGPIGRVLGLWTARIASYGTSDERTIELPAIRDGEGLLREASIGMRRGANLKWLRRGD